MSMMPTEPRSIGGVIDDAIRLYRKTLTACLPIVLIGVVLTLVPTLWLVLRMDGAAQTGDPAALFGLLASPSVLLLYLVIVVIYTAVYAAVIQQIDAMAHGHRLTTGEALAAGMNRMPAMLGVTLLFGVMVCIGLVLLLIPGIWLWGLFQLAFVAVVVDRTGVLDSFGASRNLMRGNWWRANIAIFVAFVVLIVLLTVLGAIFGVVVGVSGGAEAVASTGGQIAQQVFSAVLNLFTMSFYPCVLLAVFYDLKLRREGGDLAHRVGALSATG